MRNIMDFAVLLLLLVAVIGFAYMAGKTTRPRLRIFSLFFGLVSAGLLSKHTLTSTMPNRLATLNWLFYTVYATLWVLVFGVTLLRKQVNQKTKKSIL